MQRPPADIVGKLCLVYLAGQRVSEYLFEGLSVTGDLLLTYHQLRYDLDDVPT